VKTSIKNYIGVKNVYQMYGILTLFSTLKVPKNMKNMYLEALKNMKNMYLVID